MTLCVKGLAAAALCVGLHGAAVARESPPMQVGKHCDTPNRRLAVVVTNSEYTGPDWGNAPITQVANGGEAMVQRLEEANFCVIRSGNLKGDQMERLLGEESDGVAGQSELARRLAGGYGSEYTLVYYSGHGQAGERDGFQALYLVPINGDAANLRTSYETNKLFNTLRAAKPDPERINIVLLDTCRNSSESDRQPEMANLIGSMFQSSATLGTKSGKEERVIGRTVALFSTYERYKAFYVKGATYTRWTGAILERVARPGWSLLDAVVEAESAVHEASNGKQLPTVNGSLSLLSTLVLVPNTDEQRDFKQATALNTAGAYRDFIQSHSHGKLAPEAARRWAALPPEALHGSRPRTPGQPIPAEIERLALRKVTDLRDPAAAARAFQRSRGWTVTGTLTGDQQLELLTAAAVAGDITSMNMLGAMFANKDMDGMFDPAAAERYFRMAMDLGHQPSKLNLGMFLLTVKGDREEGCRLLVDAARSGVETARTELRKHRC